MKKTLLSSAIAILIALLITGGAAQNSEQTLVGTVSCPACVVKGSKRVDMACARTCLDTKTSATKSTDTKSALVDTAKGSLTDLTKSTSADASKSASADSTKSASANPTKSASTDLVIITDGDYKIIPLDNPDKVKSHLAHHISVTGYWAPGGFRVVSVRIL